jgi:arylformamidase
MTDKVFLHYTQAELDRNFDQRTWAPNALELIARSPVLAAETRRRLRHDANISYGLTADEALDVFPCGHPGAATHVFVHGGAWRNFTKDDYSFVAGGFVPRGINLVMVNFAKILQVPLPEMVAQVRRALIWVQQNLVRWGGDPKRLYLSGHSSGAHLGAMALITAGDALPAGAYKGAALVSGPYDMEPVLLSARSSYVKLSKAEERELSPVLQAARMPCPALILSAENDTDEFQRQSREFAAALERAGKLLGAIRLPGLNHFEIMETFGDPKSALIEAIVGKLA